LGRGQSPGHSPGSKRFLGHENLLKCIILSINFISFTAQIFIMHYICKSKQSDFGNWGHGLFAQACRGYEICHPYPYPQIFCGYPWIYPWISMNISISTDRDRRLSCVHIATKFSRNTAVPERPFPSRHFFCGTVKNKYK